MRRPILLIPMLFAGILAMVNEAAALRCDGRVIDLGSRKSEVLRHCGEPEWIENYEEERIVFDCPDTPYFDDFHDDRDDFYHRRRYRGRKQACRISINIEEWFYNFGRHRFTRTLIFENNRLVKIDVGSYGD